MTGTLHAQILFLAMNAFVSFAPRVGGSIKSYKPVLGRLSCLSPNNDEPFLHWVVLLALMLVLGCLVMIPGGFSSNWVFYELHEDNLPLTARVLALVCGRLSRVQQRSKSG